MRAELRYIISDWLVVRVGIAVRVRVNLLGLRLGLGSGFGRMGIVTRWGQGWCPSRIVSVGDNCIP